MHATVLCEAISSEQVARLEVLDRINLSLRCSSNLERARGLNQIVAHYVETWPLKSKCLFGCEALASEPIYFANETGDLHAEHFIDLLRHESVSQVTLIGVIDELRLQDTLKHADGYGVELKMDSEALIVVDAKHSRKVG